MDARMVSRRAVLAAAPLLAAPLTSAAAEASPEIIYYNQGGGLATETTFGFKVLKLALAKSGRRARLRPSPLGRVTEPRAVEAIATRNQMDVADGRWSPSAKTWGRPGFTWTTAPGWPPTWWSALTAPGQTTRGALTARVRRGLRR